MPASLIRLEAPASSHRLRYLFHARRYDEAIRELRSDDPDHWYLGFALIANGQPDEAITVLEKALAAPTVIRL